MPQAQPSPKQVVPRVRPRRRWWQRGLRAALVAVLLLSVAYGLLPWWLPHKYVAKAIGSALGEKFSLPVSIGSLSLSWQWGITVRDFRIGSSDSRQPDILQVGQADIDFSPIQMLMGRPLRSVELSQVSLYVQVDEHGNVNLAPLAKIGPADQGNPPSKVLIRQANLILELPHEQRHRLNVSDLQYQAGRLSSLGKITMSADLVQAGDPAEITLVASGRNPAITGEERAAARFVFVRLDLAQLNLPLLLGMPVSKLAGQASGKLECQVSSSGVVETFSWELRVRDLDVQPSRGPAMPVIRDAQVHLDANYDPISGRADIQNLKLVLPGISLDGKGRIHAALFTGGWEGVESLDLKGTVNPSVVVSLLGGPDAALPAGLAVEGDVGFKLSLAGERTQLTAAGSLDATTACVRKGDAVIKPSGRRLVASISANVESAAGHFTADDTELYLGGNRFSGKGALENFRQLLSEYGQSLPPEAPLTLVLANIGQLAWEGEWEIRDLPALADLPGAEALRDSQLKGSITGRWSIDRQGVFELNAVRLAETSALRIGADFNKPEGVAMKLDISGRLTPERLGLEQLWVRGNLGAGELQVEARRAALRLDEQGQGVAVAVEGTYSVRELAALAACLPSVAAQCQGVTGSVQGAFSVLITPEFRRVHATCNATPLGFGVGQAFVKQAGQPAEITLDLRSDGSQCDPHNSVALQANLGSARYEGSLTFPTEAQPGIPTTAHGRLVVTDVRWLLERIPAAKALEAYSLEGAATFDWRFAVGENDATADISLDGDDLHFRLPATGGAKDRTVPLRARVVANVGVDQTRLNMLVLDLGKSHLALDGQVKLPPRPWNDPKGALAAANASCGLQGRLEVDAAAKALWPELAQFADEHALAGPLIVSGQVQRDAKGSLARLRLDATALAGQVQPYLAKAAGTAAGATMELAADADLTTLHVRDLLLELEGAQLRGDAVVPLDPGKPWQAHLGINAGDLAVLAASSPRLAAASPSGGALLDVELSGQGRQVEGKYATLTSRDARFTWADKPCRVDGKLTLEGLSPAGASWQCRHVKADSLEVTAGRSHGFLMADLDTPFVSPHGRVEVLSENLDLVELFGTVPAATQAAAPPTAPALTGDDIRLLSQRGQSAAAAFTRYFGHADVSGKIEVDRLVYFDDRVRAIYEARGLVGQIKMEGGSLSAGYRAGVNAGQASQRWSLNLREPNPVLLTSQNLVGLLPKDNIQKQMAMEFPGNMVYGSFSRSEEVGRPLHELMMTAIDPRYTVVPVGQAKTITDDGVVRGKGGPAWMTRLFPGLNLTTYRYNRMTDFAEFAPDGMAHNDMIFSGPGYDLYMTGTTDVRRIANYEVGLILLGKPQSAEFNHRWRQGRVPLMNFRARLDRGRFVDEQVSYVAPTEAAYVIFLQNNVVYRAWLNASQKKSAYAMPDQPARPAPK